MGKFQDHQAERSQTPFSELHPARSWSWDFLVSMAPNAPSSLCLRKAETGPAMRPADTRASGVGPRDKENNMKPLNALKENKMKQLMNKQVRFSK